MADVYVLPSPVPTLYVYPSARHPASVVGGSRPGPVFQPERPRRARGRLNYRLTVTASGRIAGLADLTVETTQVFKARALRSACAAALRARGSGQPHPVRHVPVPTSVMTRVAVRCADHTHLRLPLPLFDLLTHHWD